MLNKILSESVTLEINSQIEKEDSFHADVIKEITKNHNTRKNYLDKKLEKIQDALVLFEPLLSLIEFEDAKIDISGKNVIVDIEIPYVGKELLQHMKLYGYNIDKITINNGKLSMAVEAYSEYQNRNIQLMINIQSPSLKGKIEPYSPYTYISSLESYIDFNSRLISSDSTKYKQISTDRDIYQKEVSRKEDFFENVKKSITANITPQQKILLNSLYSFFNSGNSVTKEELMKWPTHSNVIKINDIKDIDKISSNPEIPAQIERLAKKLPSLWILITNENQLDNLMTILESIKPKELDSVMSVS